MKLSDLPRPFIIADVGSNYCVSSNPAENLVMAKRHIYDAAKCGVNAVKFQLYTDLELYGMPGPDKYALPRAWVPELAAYCAEQGVEFMCTAFSEDGYRFIDQFVNVHKVASAEMKHVGILDVLKGAGKPVLISTGGAHWEEINAVAQHMSQGEGDYGFLECVACYPASPSDYDLNMLSIRRHIGVSDHTRGETLALAAVGRGAYVFEAHFKSHWIDAGTPDGPVSLNPEEMTFYVTKIKEAASSLVEGRRKIPRPSERDMTLRHRRRLKVIQPIKAGDRLEYGKNFGIYRSLTEDAEAGAPEMWPQFDGKLAKRDLRPGDPVWTTTVACD